MKGADLMKAVLTDAPFDAPGWVFERKLDGIRCLAIRDGDAVTMLSRNDLPLDGRYPEIAAAPGRAEALVRPRRGGRRLRRRAHELRPPRPPRPRGGRDRLLRLRHPRARRRGPAAAAAARAQGAPARRAALRGPAALRGRPRRQRRRALRGGVPARLGGPDRQARRQSLHGQALQGLAEGQVRLRAGAGRRRLHRAEGQPHRLRRAAARRLRGRRPRLRRQGRDGLRPGDDRRPGGADGAARASLAPRSPATCRACARPGWSRSSSRRSASRSGRADGRLRHPRFIGLREDKPAREVVREIT